MSADSARQLAFTAPRDAELHAAALADRTAREKSAAQHAAFEAMLAVLRRVETSTHCDDEHLRAAVVSAIRQAEEAAR